MESDAVDKRIEELRVAQRDLRQATEALEKATMTLNEKPWFRLRMDEILRSWASIA